MRILPIPRLSLVVLFGPTGAGKSTFAARHFRPEEILVGTDQNLHERIAERLLEGKLVVVDGGPVLPKPRRDLVSLAESVHCPAVAIVLDLPEALCLRNLRRLGRDTKPFRYQSQMLRQGLHKMGADGFSAVHVLTTPEAVADLTLERMSLPVDRRAEHGPFDVIGDLHGCTDEVEELLEKLGYRVRAEPAEGPFTYRQVFEHPQGRKAVFLGDLVDRGPRSLDAVQLVMHMTQAGTALCVPGNHDTKLMRTLRGRPTEVHGNLLRTLAEFEALPSDLRGPLTDAICSWIESLPYHLLLADGNLVVAHAGLPAELHGRDSKVVRLICLHGEVVHIEPTTGTAHVVDWVAEYEGRARVVYGHVPVVRPAWVNNTLALDTACVFGGSLTAWRYPEEEFVAVPAHRQYKVMKSFTFGG